LAAAKTGTGNGTVTSSPAGINCGSDCTKSYSSGTSVTLTATPDGNSTFAGWSGDCTGSGNTCALSMTAAKNATATFNANTYALIVTKLGTGNGTVTSSVAGINCGTDCMENYVTGTSVTLTATPTTGSTFTGWSGVCSGVGTCSLSMTAAKSVTANFASSAIPQTITFGSAPIVFVGGSGTVSATGGASNNPVIFTSQTTGICTVSGNTITGIAPGSCTVAANQTGDTHYSSAQQVIQNITISGENQYPIVITKLGSGSGTVTSSPAGIICGDDCFENYPSDTIVTLTATPTNGTSFSGWDGNCTGSNNTCTVSMTAAKGVIATFNTIYPLTVIKTGTGNGTVTSTPAGITCGTDCKESYNSGISVTLKATPDGHSTFTGWSGDCVGMNRTCTVNMTALANVVASFTAVASPSRMR